MRGADRGEPRRIGAPGFTIIELMVALVLLGTLAATATLAANDVPGRIFLWLAARQVALDLSLARVQAIATNRDHRLLFQAGSETYELQRLENGRFETVSARIPLPRGVTVESCNGRDDALQYRPRGNPASFGTVVLDRDGETRRVIVNITGHVRIG